MSLTPREIEALALRDANYSYAEIGRLIGRAENSGVPITGLAAKAVCERAEERRLWISLGLGSLTARSRNALDNYLSYKFGFELKERSVEDLKEIVRKHLLSFHPKARPKVRFLRKSAYRELCAFVGEPVLEKNRAFRVCPHCGKDV